MQKNADCFGIVLRRGVMIGAVLGAMVSMTSLAQAAEYLLLKQVTGKDINSIVTRFQLKSDDIVFDDVTHTLMLRGDPDQVRQLKDLIQNLEKFREEKDKDDLDKQTAGAEKAKIEAQRAQAEADKMRAEVIKAKAEAEKMQADVIKEQAEADKVKAEVEKANAEADKAKAEAR